jgi:hypothetical protein
MASARSASPAIPTVIRAYCSKISIVHWQTRSARPRPPGWRSTSSASSVSTRRRSCNGSRACAISASTIQCGSALRDPLIWPPCCVTQNAAGCRHRPRASRGRPACCGSCSPCRRRMPWCARSGKRARSCILRISRRTSSHSAGCCGPRAGPRRWRSAGSRSRQAADSGSSRPGAETTEAPAAAQ